MKMKQMLHTLCLVLIPALVIVTTTQGAGHGHKKAMKKGILLVAFGSSIPRAQISFENIDKAVKQAYPQIPVRWAYTSAIIRKKLAAQGKHLDSPEVALAKMLEEDFTHVAVQSLHTIAGAEFHDMLQTVQSYNRPGGFRRALVGNALLATQADFEKVVDAIIDMVPVSRKKNEGVVLMGHGTHHPANAFYAALMFQLQQKDPNIFVGCVEGYPMIDDIQRMLIKKKIGKVYLMPFMSVAGDHAINDMAGDDDDSWKTVLTKAGIQCDTILKGTAEYGSFVDIWVEHIKGPMAHF